MCIRDRTQTWRRSERRFSFPLRGKCRVSASPSGGSTRAKRGGWGRRASVQAPWEARIYEAVGAFSPANGHRPAFDPIDLGSFLASAASPVGEAEEVVPLPSIGKKRTGCRSPCRPFPPPTRPQGRERPGDWGGPTAVSYTHLTLPTILRV